MSWYETIVLSYSSLEYEEERDDPHDLSRDCEPLRKIDDWLQQRNREPLVDLAEGTLGSNAAFFGGCYNYLEVDELCDFIDSLEWHSLKDVRILYWSDNDDKFRLIEFPLKKRKRRPGKRA